MTLALKVGDVVLHIPSGWTAFVYDGQRYDRVRGEWCRKILLTNGYVKVNHVPRED